MSWNKFYFVRETDAGFVFSDCYGQSKAQVMHMNMDKFSRGVVHASSKPYFNDLRFYLNFFDQNKACHNFQLSADVGKLLALKLKDSTTDISISFKVDETISDLYSSNSLAKSRQQFLRTSNTMWDVAADKPEDIKRVVSMNIFKLLESIIQVQVTYKGVEYNLTAFEFLLLSKQGRDFIYKVLR